MKINRFRAYLFVQGLVVLGVMAAFALIHDRKMASLVASSLFVLSSGGIIAFEILRVPKDKKSLWVLGATGAFVIFFILPIIALRLMNWEMEFQDISFMGILGTQMHKASNYAFMLMLLAYFVEILRKSNSLKPK